MDKFYLWIIIVVIIRKLYRGRSSAKNYTVTKKRRERDSQVWETERDLPEIAVGAPTPNHGFTNNIIIINNNHNDS